MDNKTPLLERLNGPDDLRGLTNAELERLATETRERIIDVCSRNGGHLAPSLGTVELTLALLSTFDLSRDKLVWDVGHQSYAYKILTGRNRAFDTLRQKDGLAGFPRMSESPYDFFGVGHSSTSISAALGMATARDLKGLDNHVIAVIGDGALTGGEAFEGLNLAGHLGKRLIVVLNDNEMSIAPNVGAISRFLSRNLSRRWFRQTRKDVLSFLRTIPRIGGNLAALAERGEYSFKSFFTPGMLFEAFRFAYIGPVDGHDIPALRHHLEMAASVEDGPVLLHVHTKKGHGFAPAEKDPTHYHGVGHFDPETGMFLPKKSTAPSFTSVFGKAAVELGKKDSRIVAITAAMPDGTGTIYFQKARPDHFFDVGICEQHAVTFAAGLASQGARPLVCIYSTFLQRSYDQIIHDVNLLKENVVLAIDRAGFVPADGETHQGIFDPAFLSQVGIPVYSPSNYAELRHWLPILLSDEMQGPRAIRYPRGGESAALAQFGCSGREYDRLYTAPDAKAVMVSYADEVEDVLTAAKLLGKENVPCDVYKIVKIYPFTPELVSEISRYDVVLFAEECVACGGIGEHLEMALRKAGWQGAYIHRGVEDVRLPHATVPQIKQSTGLDAEHLAQAIRTWKGAES